MKKLILISGTMGAGKSTVSSELKNILPCNVFLDGDWCWDMQPFTVTEETKEMVHDNIAHILNNFIKCSEYENIIFCWVMHEQSIIDEVLSRLDTSGTSVKVFSLIVNEKALTDRLFEDVKKGIRTEDIIKRSIERIPLYQNLDTIKIDASNISAKEAAQLIKDKLK
ncbi:shikimate kinase [Oxobacter pfennigii]|uniref:Shikimate kinase n=1 Tax=Oxobacter pfennigii TaxID=36849 RepID=A0A0N8NTA5_9CLOT|nr:AAA family ATPase [Oxobacter pfennigii]KPU44288.1 shikimate kinase [Oxobacter pfennigii]